jgi:hypothetical protein
MRNDHLKTKTALVPCIPTSTKGAAEKRNFTEGGRRKPLPPQNRSNEICPALPIGNNPQLPVANRTVSGTLPPAIMKTKIPEELKSALPLSKWGKLLAATPIVMTVIATMLAGLASSEMTRAQYDRSLAAQLQSKAGDQWNYYQAKKLRSAVSHNSLDLLGATAEIQPVADSSLGELNSAAKTVLAKGGLPSVAAAKLDETVVTAFTAVENSRPESEIEATLVKISDATLATNLTIATQNALDFDAAIRPINKSLDKLDETLFDGDKTIFRNFTAARLRYLANRYDTEARLNQDIAGIYELQVRKNNISADRHHQRSGKFFYGMLAAQMGVIISTFAMAARQKSVLWSVAAAAGVAAVSFAGYVYFCI